MIFWQCIASAPLFEWGKWEKAQRKLIRKTIRKLTVDFLQVTQKKLPKLLQQNDARLDTTQHAAGTCYHDTTRVTCWITLENIFYNQTSFNRSHEDSDEMGYHDLFLSPSSARKDSFHSLIYHMEYHSFWVYTSVKWCNYFGWNSTYQHLEILKLPLRRLSLLKEKWLHPDEHRTICHSPSPWQKTGYECLGSCPWGKKINQRKPSRVQIFFHSNSISVGGGGKEIAALLSWTTGYECLCSCPTGKKIHQRKSSPVQMSVCAPSFLGVA